MSDPEHQSPSFSKTFKIAKGDFAKAGTVSISVKNLLKGVGCAPKVLRRTAIVAFEAEMNVVMYGGGGELSVHLWPDLIRLVVSDQGPGIGDLDLAMQEGWSTATEEMREMGFGAGMGLPNIKRNADHLHIESALGQGTTVTVELLLSAKPAN